MRALSGLRLARTRSTRAKSWRASRRCGRLRSSAVSSHPCGLSSSPRVNNRRPRSRARRAFTATFRAMMATHVVKALSPRKLPRASEPRTASIAACSRSSRSGSFAPRTRDSATETVRRIAGSDAREPLSPDAERAMNTSWLEFPDHDFPISASAAAVDETGSPRWAGGRTLTLRCNVRLVIPRRRAASDLFPSQSAKTRRTCSHSTRASVWDRVSPCVAPEPADGTAPMTSSASKDLVKQSFAPIRSASMAHSTLSWPAIPTHQRPAIGAPGGQFARRHPPVTSACEEAPYAEARPRLVCAIGY